MLADFVQPARRSNLVSATATERPHSEHEASIDAPCLHC